MRERTKQNIIRLATWLMIIVFGLILVNNVVYTHSHIKNDGTLVTHAHPFDKSNDSTPIKNHHHTQAEYLFVASINILFFISFLFLFLQIIFIKQDYLSLKSVSYLFYWHQYIQGRAPPTL